MSMLWHMPRVLLLVVLACAIASCGGDAAPTVVPALPETEAQPAATPSATIAATASVTGAPGTAAMPSPSPLPHATATLPSAEWPAQVSGLCSGNGDLATAPFSAEWRAKIDPILAQLQVRSPQASLSLAVQCDTGPVFALAVGEASVASPGEAGVPAGPDTVYALASLTKQVTAAAVLGLAEQGAVDLDAPIGRYLPQWTTAADVITVRDLLGHTSGIFSYTRLVGPERDLSAEIGLDVLIAQFESAPLDFQPGDQFSYSDSGYVLLGAIIEAVSGMPYGDYVEQQVLAPAGVSDIVYCEPIPEGMARPYEVRAGELHAVALIHFSHAYSAGGLCGTAAAVARWQRALHTGEIISAASLEAMTRSGTVADGTPTGYGLGLFIELVDGNVVFSHNGVAPGYAAWAQYQPADELSIVLLANTVPGAFLLQETVQQVARTLVQSP